MDRRTFTRGLVSAILVIAVPARGQSASNVRRIGYLSSGTRGSDAHVVAALLAGLRERGWVEGQNLQVEYRWADGDVSRLPDLARDLVRLKVEMIVAMGTPTAQAANKVTHTVPIVFGNVSDPVATGIVASLGRPEGNATGWSTSLRQISAKLVELLREASPATQRIAIVWSPDNPAKQLEYKESAVAAQKLGMTVQSIEAHTPHELDAALGLLAHGRHDGLVVFTDQVTSSRRARIVEFAATQRLPAIYQSREFVQIGGLMSYAPNSTREWRNAAGYVDRILRGAKPAEMPVEQPTKFELVINLKTAKALGLTIPQSLLLRADEVIQ